MGVFQSADEELWNAENDFSLWHSIVRELAEELRGGAEDYETDRGPIEYTAWTFADHLTRALDTGQARAFCLGIGVDPLTFATDILTILTINAHLYDQLLARSPTPTPRDRSFPRVPFTAETVKRYASNEPTQAAGAGLLQLAWRQRSILLS